MNLTTTNKTKIILSIGLILGSLTSNASVFPVIKKQVDIDVALDTASHTSSETRVFSFIMINNGTLGTYVEEKTFNDYGNIVSKTQTKRNIPFLGCKDLHTVVSQRTDYNNDGKVSRIHKSRRLSNGVVVMKDISITYSDSGKKVRQNNLKGHRSIEGYKRPSYFQVRAHRLKK